MGHLEHHKLAESIGKIKISVLTVSDSRNEESDTSGKVIISRIKDSGNIFIEKKIVKDEPFEIKEKSLELLENCDSLIVTGGTGISRRDNSVDTIRKIVDKEIPGFGEIFRMLSFEEIGSSAFLSSSFAGIIHSKPIFVIPGSTGGVTLAIDKLIIPELKHLIYELRK